MNIALQTSYVHKSSARTYVVIGNRACGKTTAISALLYSMRREVTKCIVFNSDGDEEYKDAIPNTVHLRARHGFANDVLRTWYERNHRKAGQVAVVFDDVLYYRLRDDDILYRLMKDKKFVVIVSLQSDTLPLKVHEDVDCLYRFRQASPGFQRKIFSTYFREHYTSFEEYCEDTREKATQHRCVIVDKAENKIAYVKFASRQDVEAQEAVAQDAARVIQKSFRGWTFRRHVLWNPHTAVGHRFLEVQANKDCETL